MLALHTLEGNRQRLDGGAMFGNCPRAVWERWAPPDEAGRIDLACRSLLIDEGHRKVLLETGIGAFFEPKLRERFGVIESEHVLLRSLAALGLTDESIDFVVLSHLHFDHAGGLLAAFAEGASPRLLFPKARFVVGHEALARATTPHVRDRASFIPGLVELLHESNRLLVVRGEQLDELGPAYRFTETFGHTPGMLHTTVRGAGGSVFFGADLVPGTPWVHAPITMGYDRAPELLIDEKTRILDGLARDHTWLFYTHDAAVSASLIEKDPAGRFCAKGSVARFDGLSLDEEAPSFLG